MSTKKIILKNVKPKWKKVWKMIFSESDIINFLDKNKESYENTSKMIYPKTENILETFKHFDINETKLVFIGQDPYINFQLIDGKEVQQAMGLSFSVPDGVKIPPSLRNIFKEIKNSYSNFEIPNSGNLTRWVKEEKILLLNSSLTVKKGVSNSHQKIWEKLTDQLIEYISDNTEKVIFLLLGNNAKKKEKLIDTEKHFIVAGVHPSPLSASRGFFNSNVFKKINNILVSNKKKPINWNL